MKKKLMKRIFMSIFFLMLFFSFASAQLTGVVTYDFRDTTIFKTKQSSDGNLKLVGTINFHSNTYGLDMKVNSSIKLYVDGNMTIRFLGSKYSSLYMDASTYNGKKLEPKAKATRVTTDLVDVYDFVYEGAADTLIFTAVQNAGSGSDVYLPKIDVIPSQAGKDFSTPETNIFYYFDLRDKSIVAAGGTVTIDSGLFKLESGPLNAYGYNGPQHGCQFKPGNKITLKVDSSCYIKIGGCQYSSSSSIQISSTTGIFDIASQTNLTTNCFHEDGSAIKFLYYGKPGEVVLEFTGSNNYIPYIEIVPILTPVDIIPWSVKKGIITVNSININLTAGATSTDNAIITLSEGSVVSTSSQLAYVRLNLGGNPLSTFTPSFTDSINAVTVSGDTLIVSYINAKTKPYGYKIVVLEPYIQKTGTITLNGITVNLTSGANAEDNASVTVSDGTVVSATVDKASIRINLGGKALSTYTPAFSGDISSVSIKNDSLLVSYSNTTFIPKNYIIVVADKSTVIKAEPGKTYSYNFADGSVIPQIDYKTLRYPTFVTSDGIVNINSNTATSSLQFGYHDNTHGLVIFPGNSFSFVVAGNATINFVTCRYGNKNDAIFEFTNSFGTVLGSCPARDTTNVDAAIKSFTYTGDAGVITATLKSNLTSAGEFYLHGLSIDNAAQVEKSNGKIDVWDFGAEKLDTALYNNKLDSAAINSWYPVTFTPGSQSTTNTLPKNFSAGILSWVSNSATSDRLRTTNTKLTRYDAQGTATIEDTTLTGSIYVNSTANTNRYLSLTLSEDDEVTVYAKSQNGTGMLNFIYVADPAAQKDVTPLLSGVKAKFVAKNAGVYRLYDNIDKPSYYRILRKDAVYTTINGTVNETEAVGIPAGYGITLKNNAGKTWNAVINSKTFMIKVPVGTYTLSLSDANGFIISNGNSLTVTETTTSYNVIVKKVELYTVTGSIAGLDSALISKLTLVYTPDTSMHKIYIPDPKAVASSQTYSVQLEPNCWYKISSLGVNDYFIPKDSILIGTKDTTIALAFSPKPVYKITINTTGLTETQASKLGLKFTNLNEAGYSYSFSSTDNITLRDGTYSISNFGLDSIPVEMGLTSNLTVNGAAASKALEFKPVTYWPFDDQDITTSMHAYKGLLFTGTVKNEKAKSHLTASPGATVKVPMKVGEKMIITYYYNARFTVDNSDTIYTKSGSTSLMEYFVYAYQGAADGYATITFYKDTAKTSPFSTSYIPDIAMGRGEYKPVVYVGTDKEFKTINDALSAIRMMIRTGEQRVTVMIDPGNYEEMLVIDKPYISLKNASLTPSIALANKGVDIDPNAVRITSYYGTGYNYYSMKSNQKWDADVLRVNKENGYQPYANQSGTTNGSYWNATVVVSAKGFEAENIIFENSFNQYISKKESEDIVVMWESGSKGLRPVDYGNTSVQSRSFVERAAAIGIANNTDKVVLTKCRVVGRQDSFFGGEGSRLVANRCVLMGAVDYIFGGMTAVFYKCDLAMNVSDDSNDASYLTAAQQKAGVRGFLMYKCRVSSAIPGIESASSYLAKPGYFGRPWAATTSEVVFYRTTIDTTNYTGSQGKSLISPAGWSNTLSGESSLMYEYGTIEKSGVNNLPNRVSWCTVLTKDTLKDNTKITTFNFTKGTDNWDPLPVETDQLSVSLNTLDIPVEGANSSFNITSNVGWTVSANQNWVTFNKSYGFDTSAVLVNIAANPMAIIRTATITIAGNGLENKIITVTQGAASPSLSISANALTIAGVANSTKTFDITSNANWTVSSDQSWLTADKFAGLGNSTITLTAEANPNLTNRTATVTVSATGVDVLTITVTQEAGISGINNINSGFLMYPNPARNVIYLKGIPSGVEIISIVDLKGQVLINHKITDENDFIDISNLNSGVYMVKYNNSVYKLIVE